MTKYKLSLNDQYFQSDDIEHGRLAKKFFDELTTLFFEKNNKYHQDFYTLTGEQEWPFLYNEQMQYSMLSAAISQMTDMHLSEIPFSYLNHKNPDSLEDQSRTQRRIDFWCLHQASKAGKAINYFIEVKHSFYCTSEKSNPKPTQQLLKTNSVLKDQILSAKKELKNAWVGDGDVFMGIHIIPGYHPLNTSATYTENDLLNEMPDFHANHGIQWISKTFKIEENFESQWDKNYNFVTIIGLVISKKR